jgi:hypothetical protein
VEDLEDEVAGLSTRSENWKVVIEDLIKGKKNSIDDHKEAIKNTQNNKKLFVTIEIQLFTLKGRIQNTKFSNNKWKEMKASIEHKKEVISQ